MKISPTIVLFIQPIVGEAFMYGYHLGTIEATAKQIAEDEFRARNARAERVSTDRRRRGETDSEPTGIREVRLIRAGILIGTYNGTWS